MSWSTSKRIAGHLRKLGHNLVQMADRARHAAIELPPAVYFILAASLLLIAVSDSQPFGNYSFFGALLLAPAIVLCAAGIVRSPSQHATQTGSSYTFLLRCLVFTALLYHCTTTFAMLRSHSGKDIDVNLFQEHSAAALLRGTNPYTLTTVNIYGRGTTFYAPQLLVNDRVQIGLPYPPASLFFVLPAYLAGDIRYAYVFAILLSAAICLMLRTNLANASVACLLLLSPVTRYVERQSWTEPFVLLTLACTVYSALRKRSWLPIALGAFLASKQYSVLALPFIPLLLSGYHRKEMRKLIAQSVGTAAALTLPMAFWSLSGFWRDIVLLHIRQPFRTDGLSIANLLFPISPALILCFVIIGMIFAIHNARPHPSMFAVCFGFTLLIFVATNKQAFCNYYFLIIYALLLGAASMSIPTTTPEGVSLEYVKGDGISTFRPSRQSMRENVLVSTAYGSSV